MTSRIVALDPGGTTGWAYVDINEHAIEGGHIPLLSFHHGMFTSQNHHNELFYELNSWYDNSESDNFLIVCESFEYRNASRAGLVLDSVEYIGIMKLFCQIRNMPYHMQSASQGKVRDKATAFVKPDNLKRLGLWSPSQVHAMDAYGHLLYYLIHVATKTRLGYADIALELLEKGWKTS